MTKITILVFCMAAVRLLAGPIDGLLPGHWYEIPNSHLRTVVPSPAPAGDVTAIIDAWSGGAYDTDREQLIVWGGGHVDYAGNEVYTFGPMTSGSPAWTRRTTPSTADQDCGAGYADGTPTSTHTYGTLAYAPNVQKFFSMGLGANYPCGSESGQIWSMSMATYQWDAMSSNPSIGGGAQGSFSAYDSATGYIWVRPNASSNLKAFNPVTRTFAGSYGDGQYINIEMTGAIDPVRRIMVGIGGYGGGQATRCWLLNTPGTVFNPTTSGDKTPETGDSRGFQFHPLSGKFVAWFGGSSVYTLTPPSDLRNGTWVWAKVDPASGNTVTPTAENARGTYGRFRYIPSLDIFICVNSIDENVYVYKLDAAGTGVNGRRFTLSAGNLMSVSPNPFKSATSIAFANPARERAELSIFSVKGERVAVLLDREMEPGRHAVSWNAPAKSAGFYFAKLRLGNRTSTAGILALE